ncbi:hypothetical protein LCGC14_1595470 [marine sediment metagenome]|uniref:Uncharacterized protein n=1 Tax=marine sediment metagenome TaxID=412755 RepID=A0A0F9LCY5_9ZZZZ
MQGNICHFCKDCGTCSEMRSDKTECADYQITYEKLKAENEQQADFLSLAKAEMDTLQTENIELRKLLKEAFPLLHSRADSESLGPKSLVTRIFDIALKEQ